MAVPDTAKDQDFIIVQEKTQDADAAVTSVAAGAERAVRVEEGTQDDTAGKGKSRRRKQKPSMAQEVQDEEDEFDLSDITHNEQDKSREDIIAEAEAQAFSE